MKKIAVFASGTGSNAMRIYEYGILTSQYQVVSILSNKPNAKVLDFARSKDIETFVFDKNEFHFGREVLVYLNHKEIEIIVLAGFLWLIPQYLISAYPDKIVNIHPSLLPKYGGKGMYGHHVHEAVKNAQDEESGITIHLVNQQYDEGRVLLQTKVKIRPSDTSETIAAKVLKLEHHFYPKVVSGLANQA
jgi:phosphoribosylglycinamide formyltransferase-1